VKLVPLYCSNYRTSRFRRLQAGAAATGRAVYGGSAAANDGWAEFVNDEDHGLFLGGLFWMRRAERSPKTGIRPHRAGPHHISNHLISCQKPTPAIAPAVMCKIGNHSGSGSLCTPFLNSPSAFRAVRKDLGFRYPQRRSGWYSFRWQSSVLC
jgi:hypothetical protein